MKNYKNLKEKSSTYKSIFSLIQNIYQNKGEILRFYIVGAIGLVINYIVSSYFFIYLNFDHIQSNILGIIVSLSSNFLLNKIWTFQDNNMKIKIILKQYLKYFIFNSVGVVIQLSIVFGLGKTNIDYGIIILIAISIASILNYIVNKKFIFKNKKEILDLKNKFWN
ncbi:MAG TPA: GtrA family protein [Nitrososphaeraceae archaeon]|nr:GtrA family protein [Nitrososphaeraceae archaeon]